LTTQPLRVRVLGPVRAWREDGEVRLGAARSRAVFAVLALNPGRVITQHDLVTAVWGDDPPASAKGVLHTYICGLRGAVEPGRARWAQGETLVSDGGGYVLRMSRDGLDAHRCATLVGDAETLLSKQEYLGARQTIDAAIALWRGTPLSGLMSPFAERQRARLQDLLVTLRERRAEALIGLGDYADAIAELADLAAEHPLRERFHALLMVALHRSGRSVEALEVYRQARAVLVEDLGVEPGPLLRSLHANVLGGGNVELPGQSQMTSRAPVTPRPYEILQPQAMRGRGVPVAARRSVSCAPSLNGMRSETL